MRRRKLVQLELLKEFQRKVALGVPLARLIREAELDMSQPSVANLLKWYSRAKPYNGQSDRNDAAIILASLFPAWLTYSGQEAGEDVYEGYFPLGRWI